MLHILYTSIHYTIHDSEKVIGQLSLYCEGDNFEQEEMGMTKPFSTVRSRKWKNSTAIVITNVYQLGLQEDCMHFPKFQ